MIQVQLDKRIFYTITVPIHLVISSVDEVLKNIGICVKIRVTGYNQNAIRVSVLINAIKFIKVSSNPLVSSRISLRICLSSSMIDYINYQKEGTENIRGGTDQMFEQID